MESNVMLLIIDLQKNFINDNTKDIPFKIEKLLNENNFDFVGFTKFTNDISSQFYRVLNYKGCISEKDKEIVIDTKDYPIFVKKEYTALTFELESFLKTNNINTIYLCGIDTDACVLKTALDLFENSYDVKVIADCSMSHSGIEYHDFAIKMLKKLIGIQNVITTVYFEERN